MSFFKTYFDCWCLDILMETVFHTKQIDVNPSMLPIKPKYQANLVLSQLATLWDIGFTFEFFGSSSCGA